ncbi:MAG: M16 family metallopeptidase [Pyrinomonadaceae bacterium]
MKRTLLAAIIAGLALASAAFSQNKKEYQVPFVSKKLQNGLEVIVLPDSSVPLVTVEMAVRNGSFTEPPEYNGLSHLFEHMFFKPSKAVHVFWCRMFVGAGRTDLYNSQGCQSYMQLGDKIGDVSYLSSFDQLGVVYNASTREEVVNYFFTTTSPNIGTAIRYINDAVRYPTFDPKELEDEKKVVIGEFDRNEANPGFKLNDALQSMLFYKYPTRKKPLGTRETVMNATPEMMRTIESRYYVPNNSALIVTGDVEPETVFSLAEKSLGSWEPRAVDPFKEFPLVEHPPLTHSSGKIVEDDLVQNVLIQIGWQGPSIGTDNAATYAADVFSFIITQPDSKFSRAMIDSGVAVNADFSYYTQRNVGPIVFTLITSPEKAKKALDAAYRQVALFDDPNYFTDAELANAKTILESRDLYDREKLSDYAHTLSFWWSTTGIDYFRDYQKNLRAVNRADINRYIDTYVQGKPHVGVALMSSQSKAIAKITEGDLIGK